MKHAPAVLTSLVLFLLVGGRFAAVALPAPEPPTVAAGDLVGLWKAQRWFGPVSRGALVIQRSGDNFTTDMMGRLVPIQGGKSNLSFDLPNGGGSFRGALGAGGVIHGHWYPPNSITMIFKYASPVVLIPDGSNRWKGDVIPFEDRFTFHLMLQKRGDGSIGAYLRNPERDYGGDLGVDHLACDGDIVKLIGSRPGRKPDSEVARGTLDPENQVLTLAFPSRGGTYDFQRDTDESDFYPRGKTPGRYTYHPPLARDDGWPAAALEDVGINRAGIEKFIQMILDMPMESEQTPEIDGILIARHGKLVLEEYFHGYNRDRLHETRSAAKVVTATIAGAVMQSGAPLKLSSKVYQVMNSGVFPPDLDPRKRAMTLENLLTMSSGLFCDDSNPDAPGNEDTMLDQSAEPDYCRYALNVPMAYAPGEKAVYCSINPNLALGMVSRVMGGSPMEVFDRLIGAPMKIDRYGWVLDPAGNPYGGGGIQFRPRDFMKFGQLMLNQGTWNGRRILSRDYAARASSRLFHMRNIYYGFLWWGIDYPYKDRTVHAFFAGGAGGQGVMVIPELDLVIATFAANYRSSKATREITQNYPPRWILPAIREPGDDPNAPVVPRNFETPYGHSEDSGPVSAKN